MLTGWLFRYKLDRELEPYEIRARLDPNQPGPLPPNDNGILRFNSTFIEWIDRRHSLRGYPAFFGSFAVLCFLGLALMLPISAYFGGWYSHGREFTSADGILFVFSFVVGMVGFAWVYWLTLAREFFTYTHYPIRFNRRNRTIYVFRHNGPGGVLCLPWDKAYFFVGRGKRDLFTGDEVALDLRCHVLDEQKTVRDTFAVGYHSYARGTILESWETIRLYMKEGPQSLPRFFLQETGKVSLRYCVVVALRHFGRAGPVAAIMTSPMWMPWVLMRYLVLRTCKRPIWPAPVEAACAIEPNDPYERATPDAYGHVPITSEQIEQDLRRREKVRALRREYDKREAEHREEESVDDLSSYLNNLEEKAKKKKQPGV